MSKVSKEEIIFLTPKESKLTRSIKNGVKRVLMVIISPFTTYEEISLEPEFIGPSILILVSLLLSFLDKYSIFTLSYYTRGASTEIGKPNIVAINEYLVVNYISNQTLDLNKVNLFPSLTILMNSVSSLLLVALFGLVMRLVPLCLVLYLLTSLMKGDTRGMIPGICYTLSPLVVQQTINIILKRVHLSSLKGIIVVLPKGVNFAQDERLISSAINLCLITQTNYVQVVSLINWFFTLWQLVLFVALFMGIGKFGIIKSMILTIITYVLVSIVLMPIYTAMFGG